MSWKDHPLHCACVECAASAPTYAGKRGAARGLIEQLTRRGVSFEIAGDKVRLYPKGAVVGEDLDELRRLKPAVVALLSEDDARKQRGEGRARDQLEVFKQAREYFGLGEKDGAA
jgi:hypothetical protein